MTFAELNRICAISTRMPQRGRHLGGSLACGVVTRLRLFRTKWGPNPPKSGPRQLVRHLTENSGISGRFALWAVDGWLEILGVQSTGTQPDLSPTMQRGSLVRDRPGTLDSVLGRHLQPKPIQPPSTRHEVLMSALLDTMIPISSVEPNPLINAVFWIILGTGVFCFLLHVRTLFRIFQLRRVLTEQKNSDDGLACQDDVDELSVQIRKACPPLNGPAQALRQSTFERNHVVYSSTSARAFFDTHLPGGRAGTGLVPTPLLQSAPLIFIGLGFFGAFLSFIDVVSNQPGDDPSLGLGALLIQAQDALGLATWGFLWPSYRWDVGGESAVIGARNRMVVKPSAGSDEEQSRLFNYKSEMRTISSRSSGLHVKVDWNRRHLLNNQARQTLEEIDSTSFTDPIQQELGPMLTR